LYKNQRDEKDALSNRIAALETKQAVADAVEPWRNQVLQMQIAGETANRQFAE
jgi:BMFP domain-containing protein YqiC